MKQIISLLAVCLFVLSSLPVSSAAESGYWLLSGTPFNEADSINEGHVKANPNIVKHSYEIHPGGGSMSTTSKWQEKEYTVQASFAFDVPDKIKAGKTFAIKLKVADNGSDNPDAYIGHSMGADVWIKYGERWSNLGSASAFTQTFMLKDNPPKSATQAETITEFTAPGNADGFAIHFWILAATAPGPLVINYDYENTDKPNPDNNETPGESELEESGCVFSDLGGQVEVLIPLGYDDDGNAIYDEDDWKFAKMDNKLPVGTKIKTGLDSSAVLSFADMSYFVMKPSTEVILSSPTTKESKIKLAAGNIWANVKKMIVDGSMDIEMSQAVAGIKGTIFICEEKDGTSTLKVIEGDVLFTDRETNSEIPVTSGKKIAAGTEALALSDFDAKAEYKDWLRYYSGLVITNKANKFPLIIICGSVVLVLIIAGLVLYIKKRV